MSPGVVTPCVGTRRLAISSLQPEIVQVLSEAPRDTSRYYVLKRLCLEANIRGFHQMFIVKFLAAGLSVIVYCSLLMLQMTLIAARGLCHTLFRLYYSEVL